MSTKKKKSNVKRPDGKGLAAFRVHQETLLKKDVEEKLEPKTAEDVVSSGSIVIDHILGTGGFVRGTLHEIAGEAHSGKSTLCLQTARNIQRMGGSVAYINTEKSLDIKYAQSLGVDLYDENKWFYTTENSYEKLALVINSLINTGNVDAIILDSVTAIAEEEVLTKDENFKSTQIGVAARFWSDYLKKLMTLAHDNNTLILATNQIRVANIGQHGATKDTTGGNALKFFKTTSLHLQGIKPQAEKTKDEFGDEYYRVAESYTSVLAKVDKNKWATPFTSAWGKIVPHLGYDNYEALFKLAVAKNKIKINGAWISYHDENSPVYFKVQGKEGAQTKIKTDVELLKKLVEEIGLAKPENYFPNLDF